MLPGLHGGPGEHGKLPSTTELSRVPCLLCCSDQPTGRLALVFELMDMNIYELIRGRSHYVAEERTKRYMWELLKAMDHMHRNGIFHR